MPCVYILINDSERNIYIGLSREDSPEIRLKEHNYGRVRSTKSGRPWTILYKERFSDYTSARKKEIFLKSGVGRKWIKENLRRGG